MEINSSSFSDAAEAFAKHEARKREEQSNGPEKKIKHASLVDFLPTLNSFDVNNARALDFFYLMLDENIFVTFTTETNEYAMFCENVAGKKDARWVEIGLAEMKVYFGLCIIMGITPRHGYTDYWSSDPFLRNIGFAQAMNLGR